VPIVSRRRLNRASKRPLEVEPLEPRQMLASDLPTGILSPLAGVLPAGASLTRGGMDALLAAQRAALIVSPRPVVAEAVVELTSDITRSTTFRRGTTYVIAGEVRVRAGVTLTIEPNVTVLIRNGTRVNPTLTANALIFESGSTLRATTVHFKAADAANRPVPVADNGGVFFLGSARSASKDGVSVVAGRGTRRSSFTADLITTSYLGRSDPRGGDDTDRDDIDRDDIDAISVLGMGQSEWRVKAVQSEFSGDDGFDVTNSTITLDRLRVIAPQEDGLNVTSSTVRIRRQLVITMPGVSGPDQELFDFEVDAGAVRVIIDRRATVDLRGFWGSLTDDVRLTSADMPQPDALRRTFYTFTGILSRGPAFVYSIAAD
jgi:hypothetical protein